MRFGAGAGAVHAVDAVDLELAAGATLAVVGESGCGKSALALALMRLHGPGSHTSGRVLLGATDLLALAPRALRAVRGRDIAMVFQDPSSALNPYLRIGTQLSEGLRHHRGLGAGAARAQAAAGLAAVGLADPERLLRAHAHTLSGGMRQRVMIAMALLCGPAVLLADEPTTALDATVAAQVLAAMRAARARGGCALLLVTHDLGVVAQAADDVAVMYAGRIVERAPVAALFARPAHPYTAGLLAGLPGRRATAAATDDLPTIPGAPPDLAALPPGCAFAPRCARAVAACRAERPALTGQGPGHLAACHLPLAPP